jgi:WYL_2, Sm-like SH3 beta-barrel fold
MTLDEFRTAVAGKIFSATFTKKNGETRHMVARLGVKMHLKGGELKYDAEALNYLIVFDMQKKAYRTINFNTLSNIKFGGKIYDADGAEIVDDGSGL